MVIFVVAATGVVSLPLSAVTLSLTLVQEAPCPKILNRLNIGKAEIEWFVKPNAKDMKKFKASLFLPLEVCDLHGFGACRAWGAGIQAHDYGVASLDRA